jgi:hypothetical protein
VYTYLRSLPPRDLVFAQAPVFLAAFLIAELFYKFHSFTLECLAFLATWFVLDALVTGVRQAWGGRNGRRARRP